jgi:acyl carrier protein
MNKDQILQEINNIGRTVFSDHTLVMNEATSAKDVQNWDSMTNLFFIDSIETSFSVKFSLDEILKAQNVGELCQMIYDKKK